MLNIIMIIVLSGFAMGIGLIAAIGAQNAFVLSQGIKREYYVIIPIICCLCDIVLITLGIAGVGSLIKSNELLFTISKYGGSAFLIIYGIKSFLSIFKRNSLNSEKSEIKSLKGAVLTTLAITLLNPHVYLDTVILLGSVSTQYIGNQRVMFGIGAVSASIIWFFSLSVGGRFLSPLFKKPITWKILDLLIGIMMFYIAYGLLTYSFN